MKCNSTWVCGTCSQGFTRKYSANRHNKNIHFGRGIIVRLLDYIVGRIEGRYVASNPLLFRKNNGNSNFRMPRSDIGMSNQTPSPISYGDSNSSKDYNQMLQSRSPTVQVRNNASYDSSELDYMIDLVSRVLKILSIEKPTVSRVGVVDPILKNKPYTSIFSPLLSQFDEDRFFGYKGYVCPCCAYCVIHRLDFRKGPVEARVWSADHKCDMRNFDLNKKESGRIGYVEAFDMVLHHLPLLVNDWLKNRPTIIAIKLPHLFDISQGIIEMIDPANLSKSIIVPVSRQEIITLTTNNRTYWAARAIANEKEPTPIDGEELLNFIFKAKGSTFGIFNICSNDPPGWRSEYFLIYLSKERLTIRYSAIK